MDNLRMYGLCLPLTVDILDTTVCAGLCHTLKPAVMGGTGTYSYSWSSGGATTDTLQACPSITSKYFVTVTDGAGNTAIDSAVVTVNTSCLPVCPVCINNPSFESPGSCVRDQLTATGWLACDSTPDSHDGTCTAGPGGILRYPTTDGKWAIGLVGSAINNIYEESVSGQFCNPIPPGTYTISIDAGILLRITTQPELNYTGNGILKVFFGNGDCDSSQLVWTTNPITNSTSFLTFTTTVTTTTSFSNIVLKSEKTSPSSYLMLDNLRITGVCSGPVVQLNDTSNCTGACTTLKPTIVGATGTLSYSWSPGGATTDTLQVCPSATTKYYVTITDGSGKTATDSAMVTVSPPPFPNATPDTSICLGASLTLTAEGGRTYSWSGNGLSCDTCASVIVTPTSTSVYTVSVTSGCTATDTVTITVNVANITAGSDVPSVCPGQAVNLFASGGTTYSWTPPAGNITCSTCSTTTAFPTAATIYTVTGTDANLCTATDTVVVTVSNNLFVDAGADQDICIGGTVLLSPIPTGAGTYTWTSSGNVICTCESTPVTPLITTVYKVEVGTGACSGTDSVTIRVHQLPVINAGPDEIICQGSSKTLSASGGVDYSWSPSTDLSCDKCATTIVTPSGNNQYILTGTDAFGCSNTDTINVTLIPLPTPLISADTTINIGESIQLFASGGQSYQWIPPIGLDCSSCQFPNASPDVSTTYCVTVKDSNNCAADTCMTLNVDYNCSEVFVPTAFSPNADHSNDLECVLGNCIVAMHFTIFDRWGEKVFETDDPKTCWDGDYKGKPLNTAVFVYHLKATIITGKTIEQKGNISLVR